MLNYRWKLTGIPPFTAAPVRANYKTRHWYPMYYIRDRAGNNACRWPDTPGAIFTSREEALFIEQVAANEYGTV